MKAIVAVDKNQGIGYKNDLLFKSSADLALFKEKTTNQIIIMGNNTLKSFPKPLPNRLHLVLTRDASLVSDNINVIYFTNIDDLLTFARNHALYSKRELWVVGGAQMYKLLEPRIQEWHITHFEQVAENCDTYLNVDLANFTAGNPVLLEPNVNVVVSTRTD